MKPILIILVVIYWILIGIIFSVQLDSPFERENYTTTGNITDVVDTSGEPTGFIITDIFRLIGIALLSIGLPVGTPLFFQIIFSCITFLVDVVFIVGLVS
jgi:hypothetical protein